MRLVGFCVLVGNCLACDYSCPGKELKELALNVEDTHAKAKSPVPHFNKEIVEYVISLIDGRKTKFTICGMVACQSLDLLLCEVFSGSDIDTTVDKLYGMNALMVASALGYENIVECLLDEDADTEVLSNQNETALSYAVKEGKIKVVELLLSRGAKPNFADGFGLSLLMHATIRGNLPIVKLLVLNGADIDAVDSYGETALDKAKEFEKREIQAFLEKQKLI